MWLTGSGQLVFRLYLRVALDNENLNEVGMKEQIWDFAFVSQSSSQILANELQTALVGDFGVTVVISQMGNIRLRQL